MEYDFLDNSAAIGMKDKNSETLFDLLNNESQIAIVYQFQTFLEDMISIFVLDALAHKWTKFWDQLQLLLGRFF